MSNRILLLIAVAGLTGVVLLRHWVLSGGRNQALNDSQRSTLELSEAIFPLAIALLAVHWLYELTAESVVFVLTVYTGAVLLLRATVWQKQTIKPDSVRQSMVAFSYSMLPVLVGLIVCMQFYALSLALVLTLLTAYTGLVMIVNRLVWKERLESMASERQTLVDYSRAFFPVLLFVLVFRSFAYEPFRIPSGSMEPTLYDGDFVFVNKYAYGLRLPVTETKIMETGHPERGDVVVFRKPQEPNVNFIKRVIGLPGDVVKYERHVLTINGEEVALARDPDYSGSDLRFIEYLGDREHKLQLKYPGSRHGDHEVVVPEGQYFVMGDNRDNSIDGRVIGLIPESHLVGEAERIWLHFVPWNMPRWERIGDKIQ